VRAVYVRRLAQEQPRAGCRPAPLPTYLPTCGVGRVALVDGLELVAQLLVGGDERAVGSLQHLDRGGRLRDGGCRRRAVLLGGDQLAREQLDAPTRLGIRG
jgi:hypothetical protein